MPRDGRLRVFVGDVQGCADELDDLLEQIDFDPARHALYFAGDLVNRGPASSRALRRAIDSGAEAVLGNHDLHLLAAAAGLREARPMDTLAEVLDCPDAAALLEWLRNRPLVLEWDDLILVHAGLRPGWTQPRRVAAPLEARLAAGELPLDDPDLAFFTRARHCDASGRRPRDEWNPGPGFAPWDYWYSRDRTLVCGHWAGRGVVVRNGLRALDSACVWGGELTAWIAEENRLVSVPARRSWQSARLGPPERTPPTGRSRPGHLP